VELFDQLHSWHWFVLAVVLIAVEILAPTGFFIGVALAALVLAGILLAIPDLAWDWQLLWFGVLSVGLTVAYMVYFRRINDATDNPLLNNRAAQLVGKSFALTADIDRTGAEMIGDTRWTVRCAGKISKGTRVRVIDSDHMALIVEEDD